MKKILVILLVTALFISFTATQTLEELQPENILAIDNLDGTVEDIQDDPSNPGTFLEAIDESSDTNLVTDFQNPSRDLVEGVNQDVRVAVRRTANSDRIPEVTIDLVEGGTTLDTVTQEITAIDSEIITLTFDATELADISGQGVEIDITGSSTGGQPASRNTVEIGAIQWDAQIESLDDPEVTLNNPADNSVFSFESDVTFDFDVDTFDESAEVRLYLDEQQIFSTTQTGGESVNYVETVQNLDAGEYEWYVEAEGDETYNQSEVRSFTVEEAQDPDIQLLNPDDGQEFSYESDVELEWNVTTFDEDADIQLYVNDELVEDFGTQIEASEENYVRVLEELEDGEYDWRVEADGENTFSEEVRSFTVNPPRDPNINPIFPDNETFEFGSDITFEFDVETQDELVDVDLRINDTVNFSTSQSPEDGVESYQVEEQDFKNGFYEWNVTAEGDRTFTQSETLNFTVEEPENPDITLNEPADNEEFNYRSDIEYNFTVETTQEEADVYLVENGERSFVGSQNQDSSQEYIVNEEDQDRGNYDWSVEVETDFIGVTGSETRSYTVQDPVIELDPVSPIDRDFSSDTREVLLEWTVDSEIEGDTRVFLDNDLEGEQRIETLNEQVEVNETVEVSDGETYEWYAEFESDEGDYEQTDLNSFSVEESDVSEELIQPERDEAFDQETVEFIWEVNSTEDYYTELYVNGNLQTNQTGTGQDGGELTAFTYEDNYNEGEYEWNVTSNTEFETIVSATREYVVDQSEPEFFDSKDDSGGEVVEATQVNVSALWESDFAELDTGLLYENTTGTFEQSEEFDFSSKEEFYNTSIDTTNLAGETICWRQEANDTAGNLNSDMSNQCFKVVQELDISTGIAEDITFSSAKVNATLLETGEFEDILGLIRFRQRENQEWKETEKVQLDQPSEYSRELEDLESNTEYEFKAVVEYSDVESTGDINTFETEIQPDIALESPENNAIEGPPIDFTYTPFCDEQCEQAEIFFNTTEPALFNWIIEDQEEWNEGTKENITAIDSVDEDYIRLQETVRVWEDFVNTLTNINGSIISGNLEDMEEADGNTLVIEQDLDQGATGSETYGFIGEESQHLDVSRIDEVDVQIEGAGGASGVGDVAPAGGAGGFLDAVLDVSAYDEIDIFVGEAGDNPSGGWGRFDGGAAGVVDAGGGGGSTEIISSTGDFIAAAEAGGGAGDTNDAPGGDTGGGGGGAAGGLGGTAGDANGEDAQERDGNGNGGDGGDGEAAGEEGGQSFDDQIVDVQQQNTGGGSLANENGQIQVSYEENDIAELDTRFVFETRAVTNEKITVNTRASTSGNPFSMNIYNFEQEEYIKLDEVTDQTLTIYTNTICEAGCDLEISPSNFVNQDNEIRTRFNATDNQQDALEIDYHSIEVESEEFKPSGEYESETFKSDRIADWQTFNLFQDVPENTNVEADFAENSSGSFEYYNTIEEVPNSRYIKFNLTVEGNRSKTPEVRESLLDYERNQTVWESRKSNQTDIINEEENTIEYGFEEFDLPREFDWNIRLTDQDGETYFAEENRSLTVDELKVKLEMDQIELYDVTEVPEENRRDQGSGDLLDSGLSKTFEIEQEDRNREYRFSFKLENTGLKDWELTDQDNITHEGLNQSWILNDIYLEEGGVIHEGGLKDGDRVEWSTSQDAVVQTDETLRADYIVETDTTSSNFYQMNFKANATDESTVEDTHELDKTKYGFLDVLLLKPPEEFSAQQNQSFDMETNITCREGECGGVDAAARYNDSVGQKLISTEEDTPFYIIGDQNTRSCGVLEREDTCQTSWEINATGEEGSVHELDVRSTSSLENVSSETSNRSEVTIVAALILESNWDTVDFGIVSPNDEDVPAEGNFNMEYNITVPSNSKDAGRIEIRGEDLNNSRSDGYNISIDNMSFRLENSTEDQNQLAEENQLLKENVESDTTFQTYYWLDVPGGIIADDYIGVLEIEAFE